LRRTSKYSDQSYISLGKKADSRKQLGGDRVWLTRKKKKGRERQRKLKGY